MYSLLTLSVVAGAIWLVLLSVLMLVIIRQIGILTVRLSFADATPLLDQDGPEVGSQVPEAVLAILPELETKQMPLLLVSSHCAPCRDLVMTLSQRSVNARVITLLAGQEQLADDLAGLFPKNFRIIRDPDATIIAESLKIQSTPFTIGFREGRIVKKAYVYSFDTFLDFVDHFSLKDMAKPIELMETQHAN